MDNMGNMKCKITIHYNHKALIQCKYEDLLVNKYLGNELLYNMNSFHMILKNIFFLFIRMNVKISIY